MDTLKLIKYKLFFLIPNKEKLEIIKEKTYDNHTIASLINSLKEEPFLELVKDMYMYGNYPNYQEEDLKDIFKLLTYKHKTRLLDEIDKTEKQEYLKLLTSPEGVRIINDYELSTDSRVYIVNNVLTQSAIMNFFKFGSANSDISLAVIKRLDEETLRKSLKRKSGLIKNLTKIGYATALSYLPSIEEKLSLLNQDNEYHVNLDKEQRIRLIITTNDEERMKLIKDSSIEKYKKIEIVKSLTDEGKRLLLLNKDELERYIAGYTREFYQSFSEKLVETVLLNLEYYNIDKHYLDVLINKLHPIMRIEILYTENHFGIPITSYHLEQIIESLPEEYKLEIINSSIKYVELTRKQIIEVIQKLKPQNIIKILVKNKTQEFTNEEIWKIIEHLPQKTLLYFLYSKDEEVIKFTEKYKTSFSKGLGKEEQLNIIYNRSKYGIQLDDDRKLKLLKSMDLYYHEGIVGDNVFKYFNNPNKIIDKLLEDKNEFNKLDVIIQKHLAEYLTNSYNNPEMSLISFNIIKYTNNPKELLKNFEVFKSILKNLNINLTDFIQYGINSNKYQWDTIILELINNNKIPEFIKIKNYFDKFYYNTKEDKKKNIENFLELLNAYNKYEAICKSLSDKNNILTEELKEDINFLFKANIDEIKLEHIDDIKKLRNALIQSYRLKAMTPSNYYELKNALLGLFFGKDAYEISTILQNTGYVQELNILKFNNKHNKEYAKIIDHVILMTEFIERILTTTDTKGLKETLLKYTEEENIETTKKYINYCSKYEEYIRRLYELDIQISLTNISKLPSLYQETELAKKYIKEYGGVVYDLTKSKYTLMAHVKSRSDKLNNLLSGECDGNSNFICMSPASHRGQHYYSYTPNSIVFAYDSIPNNSFICSSIDNLGSNHTLNYNTSEVPEFRRTQKGVLETSEASSHRNAETLLYREGTKPVGIIIPKGTTPCEEAIEYHKQYNIPFILTQGIDETIENPEDIPSDTMIIEENNFPPLELLKELSVAETKCGIRQIAIITDPHALYEPTMACLIDIKNKGINEIYSLGDNIGHGPSPKETIELLKEYQVKSILGNHELYVIKEDGMKIFEKHLVSKGALERTKDMTSWIKQELTDELIEEMKAYPDRYTITLPNDKKITLIHTQEPYNKEGEYSEYINLEDSDLILNGHEHFESQENNKYTLRAVGIGQQSEDDGFASYAILTIDKNDYNVQICKVPYNRSNLMHTINESSMPKHAKSLIKNWVSGK